jgi:hypothetical protein
MKWTKVEEPTEGGYPSVNGGTLHQVLSMDGGNYKLGDAQGNPLDLIKLSVCTLLNKLCF